MANKYDYLDEYYSQLQANNPYRTNGYYSVGDAMKNGDGVWFLNMKSQNKAFDRAMDDLAKATIKNGGKLSDKQIKRIIKDHGGNYRWFRDDQYDEMYREWYNKNKDYFDYAIEDYNNYVTQRQTASDVSVLQNAFAELGIGAPEQLNANGLNANYQNYLDQLNALSDSQYAVAMDELQRSENEMYRAIGMSQRQMERDIAKRRQQALKSGMSTAQLAAQEQQNLLAAQTGATMLAQNYTNQRYNTINQFATARQQNLTDVLGQQINYSNTRQQNWDSTLANMYAQIYAADKYQK